MDSADTEDTDLKAAIAMSLAEGNGEQPSEPAAGSVTTHDPTLETSNVTSSSTTFFAGLDRKAMEEERLARQARKRQREDSPITPPPLSDSRKAPKLETTTVSLPSGARLTSFSTTVNQDQRSRKSEVANASNQRLKQPEAAATVKQEANDGSSAQEISSLQGSLKYPHGVVKKTWAFGFPRTNNDIKLEEVLEPLTLRTAVLSAFQWDVNWVLAKLKTPLNSGSTKCLFIMQAETDELRKQMLQETEEMRPFLQLCFPPMYTPIHCMHSKLILLFHPDKLRIAIPTANLLNFDWGETGVMENSVFMIDLPRLADGRKAEAGEVTPFAKEVTYFLEKQRVDRNVREGLLNFDFSATKDMMFVHTAGGTYYDEEAERTGLPGLARAVRQLSLQSREGLQIDFAASSIGSLNDDYLRGVHAAARGEDMIAKAASATAKAKTDFFKASADKSSSAVPDIRDKVRIYFPTHETVTSSIAGAAGTICLNRKWFEGAAFPRTCFRDYRSTRAGLLSHNKILYARGKQKNADGSTQNVTWAYVGSANMSESAWGKLVYDKKEKAWKVVCRNWECGVLLPVPIEKLPAPNGTTLHSVQKERIEGEDSETESEDESKSVAQTKQREDIVGIEVFEDLVQPPFEIPGARYGGQQEPWYFLEASR